MRGLLAHKFFVPLFSKGDASRQPLADATQGVVFILLHFFPNYAEQLRI